MSWSHLSPEQAGRAEQIFQSLRAATEADPRGIAELLACEEDSQLLGPTEFEVRDRVHRIGAKAIEATVDPRKGRGTKARARAALTAAGTPASSAIAPRACSACWGRSAPNAPTTHCKPCHQGHCPGDDVTGLGAGDLTPGAAPAVSPCGVIVSFAEAAEEVRSRLAGLRVSEATAQRTTEAAGQDLGRRLAAGETFGPARPPWPRPSARRSTTAFALLAGRHAGPVIALGAEAAERASALGALEIARRHVGRARAAREREAGIKG